MSTAQAVAGAMFVASLAACAREPAAAMRAATPQPPVTGESTAHDYDFEQGTWHTHASAKYATKGYFPTEGSGGR
jgi:hypothetical protein